MTQEAGKLLTPQGWIEGGFINPLTGSITSDFLIGTIPVLVGMVIEARRLAMRHWWFYVATRILNRLDGPIAVRSRHHASKELFMSTDVLIVGAGPTGLMLANQLGRRGIRVTIIDRHSGPAQQTRAMAVHARTLEIFAKLGVADRALELGRKGNGSNMWSQGKLKARIPFGDMGKGLSAFPYVLMLGQDDNERILGDQLRRWNVPVRWNTELIALTQSPTHVTATIKDADGRTSTIEADYLAGCDGARSSVREMNGIAFPGAPYEHVFFVTDTVVTGSMVPDEVNVYLWRNGFHLYFPMSGTDRWRIIGILPNQLQGRQDLTFNDIVPSLRQEAGDQLSFKSCSWFSTYRIHHRCTERFQKGRCFLLGDAAHVHSPMGGQGMNTGLQDAYNLAWKLALVISGRAEPALLDSYEAERRPVAQRLLDTTDRAFRLLVSDTWAAGFVRTRIVTNVAALAMRLPFARKRAFHALSQIAIAYPQSPLSETLAGVAAKAPRAGERFPWLSLRFRKDGPREDLFQKLDDTRFNLLVIGQPMPSAAHLLSSDLLEVHDIVSDRDNERELAGASISGAAFYLLRPDGHIALAGKRFDPAALRRWFARSGVRDSQQPLTLAAS
jgi:2-polyprenyl-6-methoxyphenol hydroxylase-like FAD-dependent oxidoreductase